MLIYRTSLKWYSCQFLLVVGVDECRHACSAMRKECRCVVPYRDVAAADHRWCQILQRGIAWPDRLKCFCYVHLRIQDMKCFRQEGGATSSEHKGIRMVVAAIGQTVSLRWILLLCVAEALEEDIVVFWVFKDALAVDAAHHDMINSCARLDAAFPWHDTIYSGHWPVCATRLTSIYKGLATLPYKM